MPFRNSQSRVSCLFTIHYYSVLAIHNLLTQLDPKIPHGYDPTHAKVVLYKTKKEVQQKPRKYHVISFLSVNNSHTLALLNHVVKNDHINPSMKNVGGQW